MEKFTALEPTKLYASANNVNTNAVGGSANRFLNWGSTKAPQHLVGRLPIDVHLVVLSFLAIPDIPSYSLCSRILAGLTRDERVWERRWRDLGIEVHGFGSILDDLEKLQKKDGQPPQVPSVSASDDDFGDFASGGGNNFGSVSNGFADFSGSISLSYRSMMVPAKPTFRQMYIRAHNLLKPLLSSLSSPPHLVLSVLFPPPAPSIQRQAHTLHLLALYLSPAIKPVRDHATLFSTIRSAIDRFQANLLTAFDTADSRQDEEGMREAARASWEVWEGHLSADMKVSEWELGKVWAEKREIFYEAGDWKPLDNFTKEGVLAFDAMDDFMKHVLDALQKDGSTAVRVFPAESQVLLSFADRLAVDVVGEYIVPLLTKAREVSNEVFLKAAAASFREAWRMVDYLIQISGESPNAKTAPVITRIQAEDVIFQMFEPNMDEYLDEEIESVKQALEVICRDWERKTSTEVASPTGSGPSAARFLGSHNPAQVKRNVLASFTDVLLLPVIIVPRTVGAVGAALTTGGTAAVQGIAMLNPQRWVSAGGGTNRNRNNDGYSKNFENEKNEEDGGGAMVFDIGRDEDDDKEKEKETEKRMSIADSSISTSFRPTLDASSILTAPTSINSRVPSPSPSAAPSAPGSANNTTFDQFELLLSIDVALELIHADRESLKRVETFSAYPGSYGHRVRDTIEEVFIVFLQAMSDRHIRPGFERATERMRTYKPAEHEETMSVAPLVQFFELVHVGDMIQSMVQVYFDKELVPHVDKTDFLNAVVREKKHFENVLDDSVAAGLNAGTEVLMNQVEHIIITRTKAREYYPPEDQPQELGPTQGCTESIECLQMHCKLLKGSASREVLDVFYQEIGIRLMAILQKHIKRQIVSLKGGFQVIADLNEYYTFISSLKVPAITADFSHLKMLGHVYVVEDAKDLAQIVRDVTRYGGAYRPEDIYEFIQRRADWKKIEKTVDKAMYNLSFKEDCVIC